MRVILSGPRPPCVFCVPYNTVEVKYALWYTCRMCHQCPAPSHLVDNDKHNAKNSCGGLYWQQGVCNEHLPLTKDHLLAHL